MKYGDIVLLGRHRLMCGDATNYEDIEMLLDGQKVDMVLTDPPYGMKCQDKNGRIGSEKKLYDGKILRAQQFPIMLNDDSQDTARKHYTLINSLTPRIIMWGGQYFAHFLPVSGGWLFWDKLTGNTDFSDGELAWRSWGKRVRKYTQMWNGVYMQCNYRINGRSPKKGARARLHPTQKPVELHMQILEDFTQEGDIILDCFGGSGTTLIACELTGRTCLMMEISPDYCEIIKNRYYTLTQGNIPFND